MCILLGIVYTIVEPPLQVPDEFDHIHRAYSISDGNFLPVKKDNRLGGEIPYSIKEFILYYRHTATALKYKLDKNKIKSSFDIPLHTDKKGFEDFPNTSYYAPVSYLPHAVGLFVFKQFNCSVGTAFYGTRIFVFIIWVLCMYYFIKIVPVYKWLFTLLLLMPMNIYLANSFSADTVTVILSFLFVGTVLRYAMDEKVFTLKRLFILLCIGALLALAKVVYVGLVTSVFIIPATKFKSKRQFFLFSSLVIVSSFTVAFLWSSAAMKYYTPYSQYNENFRNFSCVSGCADYYKQKQYIIEHPFYFVKVIFHTLFNHPYTYFTGYVGIFGNSDVSLPKWLIITSYLVIFFVALKEKSILLLSRFQKLILFCASLFGFVLLLLSQHLTWDCVGEGVVDLVQGRYLLPLLPWVFLALTGIMKPTKINLLIIVFIFSFLVHSISVITLYKRFYVPEHDYETSFYCGAEEAAENNLLKTSDPHIQVDGFYNRTAAFAHSGTSSLKLSENSPYGFSYHFKNLSKGDLVEITAWQLGEGANLVVSGSGKKCKDFYYTNTPTIHRKSSEWNLVHWSFTVVTDCDSSQATFFIWHPGKKPVYIDDLQFSLKKYNDNYLDYYNYRPQLFE